MKKVLLIFPLAVAMANCTSSRNTTGATGTNGTTGASSAMSANAGTSGISASGSATTGAVGAAGSASTSVDMGTTGSMSTSGSGTMPGSANMSSVGTASSANWSSGSTTMARNKYSSDVYDPNNYMQNPDKYKTPAQLGAAGGWTYNNDWRRNTNFLADATGQWQMSLTPDVLAYLRPDTSRPETYASYWTPEAIMRRNMIAYNANTAMNNSTANASTASTTKSSKYARSRRGSSSISASSADMNGTSMAATGSGTTGAVGTGGTSMTATTGTAATADMSATAGMTGTDTAATSLLTAVNGNNYMLPTLNLFLDNGTFTSFTGSNNLTGMVVANGNNLSFQNLIPQSAFSNTGGFEQSAYIDRLSRVDSYDVQNGQIRLKQGDQVLLVLSRVSQ